MLSVLSETSLFLSPAASNDRIRYTLCLITHVEGQFSRNRGEGRSACWSVSE